MADAVGFDFGTSTTVLALANSRGLVSVMPLGQAVGSAFDYLPSVVLAAPWGFVVGEAADNAGAGALRSVKRCITRDHAELSADGSTADVTNADEVVGAIIAEAIRRAEIVRPGAVRHGAVRLGCPAMWDGPRRRRLAGIATKQGLDVRVQDMVDEPIAAGVGWVNDEREHGRRVQGRVLVVDIGGGTLDVACLDVVDDGLVAEFNVLAADAWDVAGDDIDATIAAALHADLVDRGHNPAASADPALATALLTHAARDLKVRLSSSLDASVGLPPLLGAADASFSRAALDQLLEPQLDGAAGLVRSVLVAARLRERNAPSVRNVRAMLNSVTADVQYVLLTGGTSQIPRVRDYFAAMFETAQVVWSQTASSQHAVARGLAAADSYTHLNLHRPPFDLVAVHEDGTETVLYSAYSPLYEAWQVQSGQSNLSHHADIPNDSRSDSVVRIAARSLDGREVPIETVAGRRGTGGDALALRIPAHGSGRLRLYVDGRLLLQAPGQETTLRMKRWPVLRSDDRGIPSAIQWPRQEQKPLLYPHH